MKPSTSWGGKHGIHWTAKIQLDDVDFADDLARLLHTQQSVQEMTRVAAGLNIHKGQSKIRRYNTACTYPITLNRKAQEDVKIFTYLGSIIDERGGPDADVKA
ncbi:unnamed protein product [Schistosoma curassoni]|uniref:Reverse transcriptase domain-containing protein n=1 Tax=Schistosoma curassoni TaxID=6186 RepID=A0A183KB30_9TREM|nr:unnamed protein product [Schistosoma curassoni]